MMGLAKTGGIASNGSGDYVIAASTAEQNFIPYQSESSLIQAVELKNEAVTPLFLAVIEATEEAIVNSLFAAKTMKGRDNHKRASLPIEEVVEIMRKHNGIRSN
jgi:D-aminopeptidase